LIALREKRLYNFIGHDGFKDLEMFDAPVTSRAGDILTMTTNGVNAFLSFGRLEEILGGPGDCQAKAESITRALEKENHPEQANSSVLLVRINER
jgi:hypothetical protein